MGQTPPQSRLYIEVAPQLKKMNMGLAFVDSTIKLPILSLFGSPGKQTMLHRFKKKQAEDEVVPGSSLVKVKLC